MCLNEVSNRELKPFWKQDGTDYIAHLGIMKNAVIVRKFYSNGVGSPTLYSIAQASYFPFTDAQYKTRFDNYYDACMFAENHIMDWLNSIFKMADFLEINSPAKQIC